MRRIEALPVLWKRIPRSGQDHPTRLSNTIRFCGIQGIEHPGDHPDVDRLMRSRQGDPKKMHDLLIALAFIGMVVAPALVAAKSGTEAAEEE